MAGEKSVRNMKVTTSSGKDVKDTQQVSGEAKPTAKASNETVQYETKNPSFGSLGGRNSGE